MYFAVAVRVFVGQRKAVLDEPEVVGTSLTRPDGAGMIEVGSFVRSVLEWATEELGGLEDHFDDVLVMLILGC